MAKLIAVIVVISVNSLLGLAVFLRNKTGHANRNFLLLIMSVILWVGPIFISENMSSKSSALIMIKMAFIGAVLIPLFIFDFAHSFPENKKRTFTHKIIGVVAAALSILMFTSLIVRDIKTIEPITPIFGPLYPVFGLYFVVLTIAALLTILTKLNRASGKKRTQLIFVALGFFFSLLLGMIFNLFLPMMGHNEFGLFGPSATVIFVIFTAYSIIKHRFMDIRAIIFRSINYTIVVGILALLFVSMIAYIKSGYESVVNFDYLFVFAGLVAVFGFQPLRNILDHLTDRIFARGQYNFNDLLGKLGKIVMTTVNLDKLSKRFINVLYEDVRLTRVALMVKIDDSYEIWNLGFHSHAKSKWKKIAEIARSDKVIIADELDIDSNDKETLRSFNAEVVVPLSTEGSTVGFLVIGEKRSGDIFNSKDLKLLELVAPELAIAVQHAKLFKQKEERIQELDALSRLSLSLGSTLELDSILNMIVDEAIAATGAENGSILLVDEDKRTLSIKASRGLRMAGTKSQKIKIGEGIAGWVCQHNEPTIISKGNLVNEYLGKCLKQEEIYSSLTVPLRVKKKVIGVLCVNRKKKKDAFTDENLHMMNSFAAHAAEAIENARLYDNLETTFLGTISALAKAIDARDTNTFGHSEEVTKYATAIARQMNMTEKEIKDIEIASRLHDIGKIGIDDNILRKPDRLTSDEWNMIKQHPKIAVDILKSVAMLKDIIPLILYHHEHYDGTGYPTGLACEAIPMGARIITAADSYNAMTSNRPYCQPKSPKQAIAELKRCAGTQFDPKVVAAFLEVLSDELPQRKTKAKRELVPV